MRFDGESSTPANLGITADEARIENLRDKLGADQSSVDAGESDTPRAATGDVRDLLTTWIKAIPHDSMPSKEHIYNMVDMTKSYVGATQRGIVLDLKVGPSEHLQAYADSFDDHFVSYSRGGKATAGVENQSMGTMQESNALRQIYAQRFNANVKVNMADLAAKPNDKWFDNITSYHGRAFLMGLRKSGLDVATKSPAGDSLGDRDYEVSEPIESCHIIPCIQSGCGTNQSGRSAINDSARCFRIG